MTTMTLKKERVGNFKSSTIAALTTTASRPMTPEELAAHKIEFPKSRKTTVQDWPGQAALTYIDECNWERRLGRCLTSESNARPLVWGNLLEALAFSKLPFEYELISRDSIVHPDYPFWAGSPDIKKTNTVGDIKCPQTLKSFCQLVQPLYDGLEGQVAIDWIRDNHSDGEKFYWQLVSNAILLNCEYAELVVYMPYESELPEVMRMAADKDECYWIFNANENELPYLIDGGYYQDINTIRFKVLEEDKMLLTECVRNGGQLLIDKP